MQRHTFCGGQILAIESIDAERHHVSLSHRKRLPTWNEVKIVREALCDPDKFYAMVLPPKQYYLNVHEYCFHLWEVKAEDETNIWRGM